MCDEWWLSIGKEEDSAVLSILVVIAEFGGITFDL